MIISASRRTDIPAYFSEWMMNRIKERYVYARNPMNKQKISKINLAPDAVDCIVFWSKNPKPMFDKLKSLNEYAYYFQFTLTSYDNDIETGLPLKNKLIDDFRQLSDMIGAIRVIWRYDPILINARYTIAHHVDKFNEYARKLKGYTDKVTISFIDIYKKNADNVKSHGITEIKTEDKNIIADNFSKIALENNLIIETCAEDIDLSLFNIGHARCIDDSLISRITGKEYSLKKDKNQRLECGCVKSADIGGYNSCLNGCIYCYANYNCRYVKSNTRKHDCFSPLLIGGLETEDVVTERKKEMREGQGELF